MEQNCCNRNHCECAWPCRASERAWGGPYRTYNCGGWWHGPFGTPTTTIRVAISLLRSLLQELAVVTDALPAPRKGPFICRS